MNIDLIPLGVQFTFDVKNSKDSKGVKFFRELYGYTDVSRGHKYKKEGILSDVKYLKPTRSVIILSLKDAPMIRRFFKKNMIKFSENIVVLHHNQARKLGVVSNSKWKDVYRDILGKEDLVWRVDF